jgi:ubiquinone/menaquinone biosynthesis C-methylase UbiE
MAPSHADLDAEAHPGAHPLGADVPLDARRRREAARRALAAVSPGLGPPTLPERVCLSLVAHDPLPGYRRIVPEAYRVYRADGTRQPVAGYDQQVAAEAERALELFGRWGELQSSDVVDIGCGAGQKTLVWAQHGARSVLGLDPDPARIAAAERLSRERGMSAAVRYVVGTAEDPPLPDASADVVIATEVMEHLPDPAGFLRQCERILRPGGRVLLNFKTFYSPRGAHITDWVPIPWSHLLFRERTLLRVLRRMAAVEPYLTYHYPSLLDEPPPADLVALADGGLNRITLRAFDRLLERTGLEVAERRLTGYGSGSRRAPVRALSALARVPLLNELVGGYVVAALRRQPGPYGYTRPRRA